MRRRGRGKKRNKRNVCQVVTEFAFNQDFRYECVHCVRRWVEAETRRGNRVFGLVDGEGWGEGKPSSRVALRTIRFV